MRLTHLTPHALPARPDQRVLPWYLAVAAAISAGIALDAGAPDKSWWPLTFIGVALILLAIRGRGTMAALGLGALAGFAFWGTHIAWLTLYLGPVPWLGLAVYETAFFATGIALTAFVMTRAHTLWPVSGHRLVTVPLVVAGLWVLREAVCAVWPWGGFSWGRVAFTLSESPYASLVAWLGVSGLSFLLVWTAAFLIELAAQRERAWSWRASVAVIAIVAPLAVPAWAITSTDTLRVAAVQGNTDASLFAGRAPGDILNDQLDATLPLIGTESVDVVVWPENGSDLDPQRDAGAASTLDFLSRQLGAPLVVGTVAERDGDYFNSSLLWDETRGGVADFYDKRHPVPFAEWMPARDFFFALAPDLVSLVTRDYVFGTTDTVFDINGTLAGISICFDITDDFASREMVTAGAEIVFLQTNNADFGRTDESAQQLAITRLRAIELGRSIVSVSTVGASEIIAPDGSTLASIPAWTQARMVDDVPLSTTTTPAILLAHPIELVALGLGLAGLALAVLSGRRSPASGYKKQPPLSSDLNGQ